jgi:hypothetical protein
MIVARSIASAFDLHVDASSAYWIDGEKIMSVTKAGGGSPIEVARAPDPITAIALDDTDVFFVVRGTGANGRVVRVAKTGGELTTLASGQANPLAIALDRDRVYWTTFGTSTNGPFLGTISMIAKR